MVTLRECYPVLLDELDRIADGHLDEDLSLDRDLPLSLTDSVARSKANRDVADLRDGSEWETIVTELVDTCLWLVDTQLGRATPGLGTWFSCGFQDKSVLSVTERLSRRTLN